VASGARVRVWGSVAVLGAVVAAACGAPARLSTEPAPVVEGAPPPSTVPRPTASRFGICMTPQALTELSVTRTDPSPVDQVTFVFPDRVVSTAATAVAAVARGACALPVVPPGAYNCPLDLGVGYALTFLAGATDVGIVTADPEGCRFLTGLGPSRNADQSFWDQLAVDLGLPAPREYCDPFRGRLSTAPAPCGPLL